jgi:hypothetical protein
MAFSLLEMFNTNDYDACVEWHGNKTIEGYGLIQFKGKRWAVHRLIMALYKPKEFEKFPQVNHKCDNPSCYNVRHLYCGTHMDNMSDFKERGILPKWRSEHREFEIEVKRQCNKKEKREMAHWNDLTVATTVRILRTQEEAVKTRFPAYTSKSALIRKLLQLAIDGKIPEVKPLKTSPQNQNAA